MRMDQNKSHLSKDFVVSNYQNPKKVRDGKVLKKKNLIITLIAVIILGMAFVYFFYLSSYFRIEQVEIFGLKYIKNEDFDNIVKQEMQRGVLFKHNNVFLFNINDLQSEIAQTYLLEWIEIQKSFHPAYVSIILQEKVSTLAYITQENCFNIDIKGDIVEKCNDRSSEFIQIRFEGDKSVGVGDNVLSSEEINYIIELNDQLEGQGNKVKTFKQISDSNSDLRVMTEKGFEIYFNQKLSITDQLKRLNLLIREEGLSDKLDRLNYIDLRFGEKVFYQ
ncbi:MAG TPA: hypothetical protein VMX18_00675 [Candidatus Bipolaricaulota bacterium]|nr:hypothetical protein [Candidatus Bipolaricaulota bacterium]